VRSLNLAGLLEELSLEKNTVIAELNGVIVPVEAFSSRALNAGDRVELVRFVGGG
jgi:thiamine biosynthesis protein ThiS